MARRSHMTELGSIACEELGDFGAGKEGWLVETPNLLCALDSHLLALANQTLILILPWSAAGEPVTSPVKIRPGLSTIEGESITAFEWIGYNNIRVLAIGTSCGYLMLYSVGGDLIHKQVHGGIGTFNPTLITDDTSWTGFEVTGSWSKERSDPRYSRGGLRCYARNNCTL